jgi:energy-coupling factor transporter ATP-binding protein EcfA2
MITAEGLTKRYGRIVAVRDLTFVVRPGVVTGFLGPNGAGKSATMRMLTGLDRPDAGQAFVNGQPFRELRRPLREVGTMLDARSFHPGRSARAHLGALAVSNAIPLRRVHRRLRHRHRRPPPPGRRLRPGHHRLHRLHRHPDRVSRPPPQAFAPEPTAASRPTARGRVPGDRTVRFPFLPGPAGGWLRGIARRAAHLRGRRFLALSERGAQIWLIWHAAIFGGHVGEYRICR